MFVFIAILAFGLLIAVHELGHFTAAKLLGVKVNEFAIGMGPRLLSKQGKETIYSWRAFPFGGFCSMEGEHEDVDDPRSFTAQKRWRRVVILLSGSVANIIVAIIIICVLTYGATGFAGTTLTNVVDGFPNRGEQGLMVGDTLVSINGERLYYLNDFSTFMQFARNGRIDLVIRRDGKLITYKDFPLERREYLIDGQTEYRYGLSFNVVEATAVEQFKYNAYQTMHFVRLIRVSIAQIINGSAGFNDISGPVGIVDAMNTIGQEAAQEDGIGAALGSIAFFMAFIGVNLAVMNLLPIPALDGGRILFVFLTWFIEKIIRRRLDPKYEGYVNMTAMALLLGFMAVLLINDVVKLVR